MYSTISTLSQYNKYTKDVNLLQSNISKAPDKINGKIESYTELGNNKQVENFINIKKSLNDIDDYIQNSKIVEGRLTAMDKAIEGIIDIATNMKKTLALRNSIVAKNFNIKQIASSSLENIESNLNAQFEGRYLFGGSKILDKPVSDLSKSNVLNDIVTSNYYSGDSYIFRTQVTNSFSLDYGITAADPAFQNLIAAINYAIAPDLSSGSKNVTKADKLLDQSILELTQIRANVGDNLATIQQFKDENLEMKLYYTQKEIDIMPDTLSTMMQLSTDKTALEALFKSFSMVSKLNLTSYL